MANVVVDVFVHFSASFFWGGLATLLDIVYVLYFWSKGGDWGAQDGNLSAALVGGPALLSLAVLICKK